MEATDKKKAAPPYVSYKTLVNFLDRFKQGVPGRIDRGLMGSMSGAAQSQVTTALRYLQMISENGIPTDLLRRYVSGDETERKAALRAMLDESYPFIFGGVFNLSTATGSQLREAFAENTSATGETLQRCIAFFKDAASDADFVVSPYITQKQARSQGPRRRASSRREEKPQERPSTPSLQHHAPPPVASAVPAMSSLLLSGLFQRLPKPGTVWPKEERERWIQTLNNVLLLEYPDGMI